MTLVGTRPELIKLSRVIAKLEEYSDHVLVHSGQNYDYELNQVFFDDLGISKPSHFLEIAENSVADSIAMLISRFDRVLEEEQPHAILVYGDTNTCLGVIPAKRRKIPIFHMEAGNRCFDQRVPEEINRKIVDHLSDVNMTNSERARSYLLAEGLRPQLIIKTGSPMKEVLDHYRLRIESFDALQRLGLEPQEYILVSTHREENVDPPQNLTGLLEAFVAVTKTYGKRLIVSTHPRTRRRLLAIDAGGHLQGQMEFMSPFGFFDYVKLQTDAFCVLSDSGTLMEESALLRFPAVMLRESHERPEGSDAGILIFSGLRAQNILNAIDVETHEYRHRQRVADYEVSDVSAVVLRTIFSYIDYVERTIWMK